MIHRLIGSLGDPVAATIRRQEEEEEEEMTSPDVREEIRFEYKIIRSATGAFKNPSRFKTVLEEEARAGWELLEKLSDHRVRLCRHVKWRAADATLSQDPYRIKIGVGEDALLLWILVGCAAAIGLVVALVTLLR